DADHEALVQVPVDLLVDGADDRRRAVAEVLAGDAAGEVEVLAAVGVPDARAPRARDDEVARRDPPWDVPLPIRENVLRGSFLLDPHTASLSRSLATRMGLAAGANHAMRSAILAAADSPRVQRLVQKHGMRLGAGRFVAGET